MVIAYPRNHAPQYINFAGIELKKFTVVIGGGPFKLNIRQTQPNSDVVGNFSISNYVAHFCILAYKVNLCN
jgi:hypothetical protein